MIELFWTKNDCLHEKVEILLARRLGGEIKLFKNENGKPYVGGNALYFSISHSCGRALIAVCDRPVGVDLEFYGNMRPFGSVLSRFGERERAEIGGEYDRFLQHWVVREAYIKMKGGSLARDLKRLEYCGGRLYFDGTQVPCACVAESDRCGGMAYALCAEEYDIGQLSGLPFRRFRLRKGESLSKKGV